MTDRFPPAQQRPALLELAEALKSRDNALRRDECGDWRINGKHGHIYAVPGSLDRPETPGFQIIVVGEFSSGRWWGAAKRGFSFAELAQDGDDEGVVFLHRLPTPGEADTIRHYLGIGKKREISDAERERLKGIGHRFAARPSDVAGDEAAEKPASDDSDGSLAPSSLEGEISGRSAHG